MASLARYGPRDSREVWAQRASLHVRGMAGDPYWFRACFGRFPAFGELDDLEEYHPDLPVPSGAMLGVLLGMVYLMDYPGDEEGDLPVVLALPRDRHLVTLLPAVAQYLVRFPAAREEHSDVVAGLGRFLPAGVPDHLGPEYDSLASDPDRFLPWIRDELMGYMADCQHGRRYWRRRVTPLPPRRRMPPPPRRSTSRAVEREEVGEVMIGAWPERTPVRRLEDHSLILGATIRADFRSGGWWCSLGSSDGFRLGGHGNGMLFILRFYFLVVRSSKTLDLPLVRPDSP